MRYIGTVVLIIAAVALAGVLVTPARAEISFDVAYSNLNQHGSWLVSAQYGHVWQPREYNPNWNPYYDGHWVYTEMGWAWVSDYQWGAIPYHYGTWVADPNAGWVWIPGNIWAPSWVVFRTGSGYIGWAPVPPGFSVGMSIEFGGPSSFVYVSSRDFLAPRLRTSIIPMNRTNVFINNTTVVNNIVVQNNVVVNRGPDYRTVEKATGHAIREQRIESVARVAPFQHVSRAQLEFAPERAKHGLRAAEPVPASRPLPVADTQGSPARNTSPANARKTSAQASADQHAKTQANAKANADQHAKAQADAQASADQHAKTQANAKANADQHAKAQADAKASADQHAKTQANAKANADQHAKAQADAKATADQNAKKQANAQANADQHAKAQANAKATADQNAKKQANAKANADQHAKAQASAKATADQNAKKQANAKATADQNAKAQANAKANADQNAKAQADAKAKVDAKTKGKKDSPDKKDQSPDKPTTQGQKEGTRQ